MTDFDEVHCTSPFTIPTARTSINLPSTIWIWACHGSSINMAEAYQPFSMMSINYQIVNSTLQCLIYAKNW